MSENILENITGIELGNMTMDAETPSTVLIIKTRKSNYIFRLSESFPIEKQINIFRAMVMDLQSESEELKKKEDKPAVVDATPALTEETHDGAKLFDEPTTPPSDVEITVKE